MSDNHHSAIVTGGSRGIGLSIVGRLLRDGSKVLACGRGERPSGLDREALWIQADVAKPEDCHRIVEYAHELFGSVSLLVNNAGIQIEKTVLDTTDADWNQLMSINCGGVFNMARAVLPEMVLHGGVIINMGSVSGNVAEHGMAIYNASKSFVHGLTRAIAVDHGPTVRCNAVQPGWIMTEMTERGFAQSSSSREALHDAQRRHPLRRLGDPSEIADAVAWLASDEARFITGQFLTVDGGLTAGSPINPGFLS